MDDNRQDRRSPVERVGDLAAILEAMRLGVREAVLRHKRLGNPIAVWRDGGVVWIPPEEIDVDGPAGGKE
jgi:hypothetical protein